MLSFDDDDVCEYGPQHSTPIKPPIVRKHVQTSALRGSPLCMDKMPSMAADQVNSGKQNCDGSLPIRSNALSCASNSDQSQGRHVPESGFQYKRSVDTPGTAEQQSSPRRDKSKTYSRMRPSSAPRSQLDMNTCNHSNDPQYSSYSFTEFRKVPAAYIEQDIINKQRHEIQLLMEELGTRDQELNDLVLSHQKQVKAWENDCEKLSSLQERINQYEEELKRREDQLRETLLQMSKVNEQRGVDARELERTKDEMMKLAERIMENSLYIQEMEAQNQKLSGSLKELVSLRNAFSDREQELVSILDEKEYQLSDKQQEVDKLMEHIKFLECRCEELEEKNANLSTESSAWKKKYCFAKDETDRLTIECAGKEENLHKMTQQLHESLQQAIALQKALFTSCEREKCKEEVMYSLRKQHKRTMQELQNIRELYDRQNRDAPLYHLSVKDKDVNNGKKENDTADEGKKKKDESRQKKEDDRGKQEARLRSDRNMSFHIMKPVANPDTVHPDPAVHFFVKEKKEAKTGENTQETIVENFGQGDGFLNMNRKAKTDEDDHKAHMLRTSPGSHRDVKNEQLSPIAVKAGHTQMCRNATITSSGSLVNEDTNDSRQCQSKMSTKTMNSQDTMYMQDATLDFQGPLRVPEDPAVYRNRSETHPSPNQKKSMRSRTTSPIVIREGPNSGKQRRADQSVSSPGSKRVKDQNHHVHCESSSDVSHLVSPPKFDDELTPADSDGMCHELKRDISRLATACCDDIFSTQDIAAAPLVPPVQVKLHQSLPNPKKSSFLRKEKVEKKLSFSPNKDCSTSPNSRYKKKGSDNDGKREQKSGHQSQEGGHDGQACSPLPKGSSDRKMAEKGSPIAVSSKRKSLSFRENAQDKDNKTASKDMQSPQGKKNPGYPTEKVSPQGKHKEGRRHVNDPHSGYGNFNLHHHATGGEMTDSQYELDGVYPQQVPTVEFPQQNQQAAQYLQQRQAPQYPQATQYPDQSQSAQSRMFIGDIEKLLEYNNCLGNPNKYPSYMSSGQATLGETQPSRGSHFEIDPFFVHTAAVKEALSQPGICGNKRIQFQGSNFDHFLRHWSSLSAAKSSVDILPEDVTVYLARQWPIRPNLYFNNNQSVESLSDSETERKCDGNTDEKQDCPINGHGVKDQGDIRHCEINARVDAFQRKKSPDIVSEKQQLQEEITNSVDRDGQKPVENKRRYSGRSYSQRQSESVEARLGHSGNDHHSAKSHNDQGDSALPVVSDIKFESRSRPRTMSECQSSVGGAKVDHFVQEERPGSRWGSRDMKHQNRFDRDIVSDGSSEGNTKDGRSYFYIEAAESKTDAGGIEELKKVQKEGQESEDIPVIAPIPSKPFTSTKGPSLYKHLSQIHFSEKTGRYEWVSRPVFTVADSKLRQGNADKSANCASSHEKSSNDNIPTSQHADEQKSGQVTSKLEHSKDSGHYKHHGQFSDLGQHSKTEYVHPSRGEDRSPEHSRDKRDKRYSDRFHSHDGTLDSKASEGHSRSQQSLDGVHERSSKWLSNTVTSKSNSNNNSDSSFAPDHCPSFAGQLDKSSNNNSEFSACQRGLPSRADLHESCVRSSPSHLPSDNLDPVVKRLNFDDTDVDGNEGGETLSSESIHPQGTRNMSCGSESLSSGQDTGIHNSAANQTPSDTDKFISSHSAIRQSEKETDSDYETNNEVESQELFTTFNSLTPIPAKVDSMSSQSCDRLGKDQQVKKMGTEYFSSTHCHENLTAIGFVNSLNKDPPSPVSKVPNEACLSQTEPTQSLALVDQNRGGNSTTLPDSNRCDAVNGRQVHGLANNDKTPLGDGEAEDEREPVDSASADPEKSSCLSSLHTPPRSLPEYFHDISSVLMSPKDEQELDELRDNKPQQDHDEQLLEDSVQIKDFDSKVNESDNIPQKDFGFSRKVTVTDKLCNELLEGHLISQYWVKNAKYDKNVLAYSADGESKSVINECNNPGATSHTQYVFPNPVASMPHLNIATQQVPESLLDSTRDSNTSTLSLHSDLHTAKSPAWVYQGSYEEAADQFDEKLSSFLEDPAEEPNQYSVPMSPASKLYRLLVESQEMIRSLEKSSAIPAGMESKVLMPSSQ